MVKLNLHLHQEEKSDLMYNNYGRTRTRNNHKTCLMAKHVPLTVSSAEVDKVLCILLIIVEETLLSNGIQEIIAIASITT